jgi:transcriptional regulator
MAAPRGEVLQGTLDLIVLQTLHALGPLHGYGIAQRVQQVSEDLLKLNQGTLYPALLRLEQRGWISAKWGASENNRKAKYYSLTRAGRKQLLAETASWERMTASSRRYRRSLIWSGCAFLARVCLSYSAGGSWTWTLTPSFARILTCSLKKTCAKA